MFEAILSIKSRLVELRRAIIETAARQRQIEERLDKGVITSSDMEACNPHFNRNFLPNDDSIAQKTLVAIWRLSNGAILNFDDLLNSGFRVFSQNDEDGILLRLLTHVGTTNRFIVEVGSNCNGSTLGIPENLSSNLIINHGWHGVVFEMDEGECAKTRYFFARDHATRHFHHVTEAGSTYFSPLIVQREISPENIEASLNSVRCPDEPDVMVIDIDGGDYAVMESLNSIQPRILVVEFEKRFRDKHRVVQCDRSNFSRHWPQSGAASLAAWQFLLGKRGYVLSAIAASGFNAFFVRSDVAEGKVASISVPEAFSMHPIFSAMSDEFWLNPDETWMEIQ